MTTTTEESMAAKRKGTEPTERPERSRLTVYLPPETHRALLHRAVDEGTKLTRIVEQLIDEYLARPARKGGQHGR
jgi:hypothetical protein